MSNTTNDPAPPYREKSMTTSEMFEEWQKCLNDPTYFREHYTSVNGDMVEVHMPNWMKAFEMIQPFKQEPNEGIDRQRELNRLMSEQAHSGSIIKDELLKWLDIEIAMAEENLEAAEQVRMMVAAKIAGAMLATYKAVKAHIEQ